MLFRISPLAAVLLLAAGLDRAAAQSAPTAAIIGLIGSATHASQELEVRLTEAQAAGNRTWADLKPAFEELLARHLEVARTLRTAWGLMATSTYDPTARVAGLPAGQVEALNPVGFYTTAAGAHQAVNGRMNGLLDLYADELGPEAAVFRRKLEDALSMAVLPRRW